MWEVIGAVGTAIALLLAVWYKQKQAEALDILHFQEAERRAELLAAQARARDETERKELEDETREILAVPDPKARERLALELLARVRGMR